MYQRAYGSVFLIPLLLLFSSVCVLGLEDGRELLETPAAELGFLPVMACEGVPDEPLSVLEDVPLLSLTYDGVSISRGTLLHKGADSAPADEKVLTCESILAWEGAPIPVLREREEVEDAGIAEPLTAYAAAGSAEETEEAAGLLPAAGGGTAPDELADEPEEYEITAVIGSSGQPERVYELGEEDLNNLQRIVEAEAGSEDEEGKLLVANVVLNRVDSELFPDTVTEVVLQESQFSPVSSGRFWKVKVSDETVLAVQRALEGENLSQGALYFAARKYAGRSSMKWFDTHLEYLFSHGGHEFFR